MKKSYLTSLLILGTVAAGQVFASASAPSPSNTYPWYVAVGMSYPFMTDTGNASGNLETTDVSDSNYYLNHQALHYTNQISPEILLGYQFTDYFALGILYSQINSNVDSNSVTGSGSEIGRGGAYTATLTLNNFLIQPHFIWQNATHLGGIRISPYAGLDLGMTSIQASNQSVSTLDGSNISALAKQTQVNFAWGAELGVINTLSQRVNLTLGIRYLNYGQFNSGTQETNGAAHMKQAVKATLYSVAPFINLSYGF